MSITLYELKDSADGVVYVDVNDYGDGLVYLKQDDSWVSMTRKDLRRLAEWVMSPQSGIS